MNTNKDIGERIRSSRKKLKMSMKELGRRVELHESTVSRYEQGEIQSLDLEKLKLFASVLNVSADYLIGWDLKNNDITLKNIAHELGVESFNNSEIEEIYNYCKYLISKREK